MQKAPLVGRLLSKLVAGAGFEPATRGFSVPAQYTCSVFRLREASLPDEENRSVLPPAQKRVRGKTTSR